jgi:LuxR family transcriptional regulator, maltose regulon positive regulatory protein
MGKEPSSGGHVDGASHGKKQRVEEGESDCAGTLPGNGALTDGSGSRVDGDPLISSLPASAGTAGPSGFGPSAASATAKWGIPEIGDIYRRTRLIEQFDSHGGAGSIWVSAPAGFGKTCAGKAFAEHISPGCLWYTLDRGDSDAGAFFSDFGSGLKHFLPEASVLDYSQEIQEIGVFAATFFRTLFSCVRGPQLLVLDDYHEVLPSSPLHLAISAAMSSRPASVSLLILSREGPPPAFARAQVHSQLTLITGQDLRLTREEATCIAAQRLGPSGISDREIRAIHEQVDGWAAGFFLFLRSSRKGTPVRDRTDLIFSYFAEEVVKGTDGDTLRFLLQTAWLPAMTVDMAEKMSGDANAPSLLRSMVNGNFFLSFHEAKETTYRYHQLFRNYLLDYCRAAMPLEERDDCARRAAVILEEAGQLDAAVALWRDLGNWDALTQLVCRVSSLLLGQGRASSLDAWLSDIPDIAMVDRPWLIYWNARACLYRDPLAARTLFAQAFHLFCEREEPAGAYLAWSAVAETYWLALDPPGPLADWLGQLQSLQARWPRFPTTEIEIRVAFGAFFALIALEPGQGDLPNWEGKLLGVLESGQQADLQLMTANLLMFHYVWNVGDRGRASLVLRRLHALAQVETTAPLHLIIGRTWGDFSYEYCFGGAASACLEITEQALAIANERGAHLYDFLLRATAAYACLSEGNAAEARLHLNQLWSTIDRARVYDRGTFYFLCAWEAWLDGRLAEAREAGLKSLQMSESYCNLHPVGFSRLAMFQIELSLKNRTAALRYLGGMLHRLPWGRCKIARFARMMFLAQFAMETRRSDRCRRMTEAAFSLGKQQGYFRIPFFDNETLANLCSVGLRHGLHTEYAGELVRLHGLQPPPIADLTGAWPWSIKIAAFGHFTLLIDDEPIKVSRKAQRKPIHMLKTLICFGGKRVSAQKLIDGLWPDTDGDVAANALKVTLYRLRKLLGCEEAIQLREGLLSLNPRHCWLDIWAFDRVSEEMQAIAAAPRGGEPPLSVIDEIGRHLFFLYRGRLLDQDDASFASNHSKVLHHKFLRLVEALGAYLEKKGLFGQAVQAYERALEIDPEAERLVQRRMHCQDLMRRRH